jgi:ATP-dependent RNA helicase DDX41
VEGQQLLPPILDFKDMKFPSPVLRQLAAKNITRPTPIQMQVCELCDVV